MNLDQARQIFERTVLAANPDCVLVEGATLEYPDCFLFFYQSRKFVETGDFSEMLVGRGPVLVSRADGIVFETGSAFPTDHYVKAFDACGDPSGMPTENVRIFAWHRGGNKVRATQLVKEKSGMGLAQAKAVIDQVLAKEVSFFSARTIEDAEQAVIALSANGFECEQVWSKRC